MTLPVAVSPSVLTPGLYLVVNLIAGVASPSTGVLRVLLLSPKSSSGDLTDDTEIRRGAGPDSAAVAFGQGTPGHLAAKQLYAAHPTALVDFGSPVAGSGSATGDLTFTGAPATNNAVEINVHGRSFEIAWLVGETADDARDKAIDAINQRTDDLNVVASSGGAGVVTSTGKALGNISNDVKIFAKLVNTQTGTETVSPNTPTALSGGATDPDFSNILDAAQGTEYHFILPCLSNTDAEQTGASSNAERVLTHIEAYNEGLDAKLQTLGYASTGTRALARTAAVARNVGYAEHTNCQNGLSLPCEFAAAEVGDTLKFISIDPAANRIGNRLGGDGAALYGSDDINADKPTLPDTEADIGSGVTTISYDASENLIVVRPVTTYSQNAAGGPDRRLLDTQNVHGTYIVARDLRSALPAEFPNAKIQRDTPPGGDPPPPGVIEERDVKAFVISRLRFWQRNGVVLKSALDTVIENGELIVRVNDSDSTQVDLVVPFCIIPPLAKFGLVVNRMPC